MAGFLKGFSYPFKAIGFIRTHPGLLRYVAIPLLINTTVFSLVVYFSYTLLHSFAAGLIPEGDAWYWVILTCFYWIAAVLMMTIVVFFSFTVIGCLIASPFNDILSERTEEILSGEKIEAPFSLGKVVKDCLLIVTEESKKMVVFIGAMICLLPFYFIPVVGMMIHSVLSFLLISFFLVIEYTGYYFGRRNTTFQGQRRFVFSHKLLSAGFGVGTFCLLAIPLIQMFCIPLGVIGATCLCYETDKLPPVVKSR